MTILKNVNLRQFGKSAENDGSQTYPPTFTQESIWLIDRVSAQGTPAYNEPLAFHIRGPLRVEVLRMALHAVVARHKPLRTSFNQTPAGLQAVVRSDVPEFVEIIDVSQQSVKARDPKIRALIDGAYRQPFDLDAGPLLRAVLVVLSEDEAVFGLTAHHIATDGWGLGVVLDEIREYYQAMSESGQGPKLPDLEIEFPGYAAELRESYERDEFREKIEYWKGTLAGGPDLLRLPLDRARSSTQTFRGATRAVTVPRQRLKPLFERCRRECGSTEFTVLMSAYAALLHRYSQQDAVTIATTVLNRGEASYLDVVGCFVNTVALALRCENGTRFRDLLTQVGDALIAMLRYQDAPYPKVLEALDVERQSSHNPVFQTMLTFLGRRKCLDLGERLNCQPYPVTRVAAKFDVLMYVTDTEDGLEFEAEFNSDLFDAATIDRMLGHYRHLLERLSDALDLDVLDLPVSQLPILPDDERRLILDVWNDTIAEYPASNVIDLIEQQARRSPDAVAVEDENRSLTYGELNQLSNRVGRFLRSRNEASGDFIGVYMDRSIDMVVALVSIVKAGLAYVPIDPEYPVDRVRYMIEDSDTSIILTQQRYQVVLSTLGADPIVLSELADRLAGDDGDICRSLNADSRVYMIYTSGSTGRPKGVVNRHGALFNRLYWMQSEYCLTNEDRVLQKTPFSFDVSVWEFFWPLMVGARIVMARPGGHRDTTYLKELVRRRHITTLHFVPSMLAVFLEENDLAAYCGSLRRVFCSGEALPYQTVKRFHERMSSALHNLYGPTEAAIDVSYWRCSPDYPGKVVPIGRPIANIRLYVLDQNLRLQPIGVPGELCIGGVGLAEGYHNRDDLTRKAFVPDPYGIEPDSRLYRTGDLARYLTDGNIEYLGRLDDQIKLRGLRIELGEIEVAVRDLPDVTQAAVVLHQTATNKMLVGYVVAEKFDEEAARNALRARLPEYMVPQALIPISAIPTTVNGKLDRRALPDPAAILLAQGEPWQPETDEERLLTEIWGEVLGAPPTSADSDLFRLGGDSIHSIQIAARLRESGYQVRISEIFKFPTIRQLSKHIASRRGLDTELSTGEQPFSLVDWEDRGDLPSEVRDAWPLTMLQAGMIYHSMLRKNSSIYHDVFAYELRGTVDVGQLLAAIQQVAADHPQLRSAFDLSSYQEPLQLVYQNVEIPVAVVDLRDGSRDERAATLDRWIEEEKHNGFDLEVAPLIRIRIHLWSDSEFNLGLAFHHATMDGWSVALVVEDIRRRYVELLLGARPRPLPERLPYSTYVAWERSTLESVSAADHWRRRLAGSGSTTIVDQRVTAPAVPVSIERVMPPAVAAALRKLGRDIGVPAKSVFLALHLRVLGFLSQQGRVNTGLVSNGRPELPGAEQMVGLFLNTLPFHMEISEEDWPTLIRGVFAAEQADLAYRRFPLAEMSKRFGEAAQIDVVFNYTDFRVYQERPLNSADSRDLSDVAIVGARYFEHTNFDVVVHAHQDNFSNQMLLVVNYDAAQIAEQWVDRYLRRYLILAAEAAGLANSAVATEPERSRVDALSTRIAETIARVLGVQRLHWDDNYLKQGLDSITAIRVVARLKRLGLELSLEDLFSRPTVRQLVAAIAGGPVDDSEPREAVDSFDLPGPPPPAGVVDTYPATRAQLYMIEQSQIDPAQAVYHDVFAYHLALPLDETLLAEVLRLTVNRHDILRTAFDLTTEPARQYVHAKGGVRLRVTDLSRSRPEDQDSAFADWFVRERSAGFDLSRPELMRFFAHRRDPRAFTLTVSFHHAVIDGWSLSLLMREIIQGYGVALESGAVQLAPVPKLAYRDFVLAELDACRSVEQGAFWQRELRGYQYTSLPASDNLSDPRWREVKLAVSAERQRALTEVSDQLGVPLKHTMLAVHLVVLAKLGQRTDVLTGVFANGRLEEEDGENVIGMFLNFLPFRQSVAGHTWQSLITEVFANDCRRLRYRRYPLSSILADSGRKRIMDTVFNYTQFDAYGELAGQGIGDDGVRAVTGITWFEHTDFRLLSNVGYDLDQKRMIITLNANGRATSEDDLQNIAALYDTVITHLTENPTGEVTTGR